MEILEQSRKIFDEMISRYGDKYDISMDSDECLSLEPKDDDDDYNDIATENQSTIAPALRDLMK